MTTQQRPCIPRQLKYTRDNGTFFGRQSALEWIHASFIEHRIVTIYGLGGIGKTRIAVEYIYAHEKDYSSVFWVNADTNETIISSFVGLAQQMVNCESRSFPEQSGPNFTSIVQRYNLTDPYGSVLTWANVTDRLISEVLFWLSDDHLGNWLLVLDNVDSMDEIDLPAFFPSAASGRILITSRNPDSRQFGFGKEIGSLAEDAAVQLLLQKAGKQGECKAHICPTLNVSDGCKEDQTAREIIQHLEYFPLAIEQAGAYIWSLQLELTTYIEQYQRDEMRLKEVFANKPPGAYPYTINTTWEVSFKAIEHRNPYAAHLLTLCGFFDPDDIPMDLFRTESTVGGMTVLIWENNTPLLTSG